MVQAAYRRLYLRDQNQRANKASVSLGSRLYAQVSAYAQFIGFQGSIIATSGNGRASSWAIPDRTKFTTSEDKAEMVEDVVDLYEQALVSLNIPVPADNDPSSNTTIFQWMMASDYMQKVTSVHIEHTLGRWPSGAGLVP